MIKVYRESALQVAAGELGGKERGDVVDKQEEDHRVGEAVHVPKHGDGQRAHVRDLKDDAVEARKLEDR